MVLGVQEKPSLLNLTKYFLAQSPEQERPLVVDFNPWWFSGHEDLTRRFFDQLEATLAKKLKSRLSTLRGHLADFADVVSETSLPYTGVAKLVSKVARPKPKDVPELKKKVAEELLKQKKRILVIIDDIDRLTTVKYPKYERLKQGDRRNAFQSLLPGILIRRAIAQALMGSGRVVEIDPVLSRP